MSSAPPPRWTRPAQFLVYLVPVGGIPRDLFAAYARLLQTHSELPLRSLTRPGGYAAELSPFLSLDWSGTGALRFRFESTAERVEARDGEDAQACRRVVGAVGVCHSPSLTLRGGLRAAHAQFEAAVRRFPGLLLHKLFAFEHTFEDATAAECAGLKDLVMFPVHHELEGTGESTVSLHLQVVMDTLAVNVLMALESVIRSATSSAAAGATADLASVLLDVNVEPQAAQAMQTTSSPLVLSRDAKGDAAFGSAPSPTSSRSSGPSFSSIPSPLAALDPRNRRRKRQLARREKLLGDYSVLVSCIADALDHYTAAIEMLREEERRSGGAPGDALWLAAALEGYVFCLYTEAPDKFSTEVVEKASEAVALYAKAGTTELESLLIENLGWYYARVARTSLSGEAKVLESVWAKRLLWDVLERGLVLFPELQPQRQVEFLIQTSQMLEAVGHRRRVAFFLHEAASLLLARNSPSLDAQSRLLLSPSSSIAKGPQRQRDLEAALMLERVAAERLGIQNASDRRNELPWEVTTQYRRGRRRKATGMDAATTSTPDNAWLIIRFHVLRQLLTISRMLGDALLVGTYCLQLLEMLAWCDSIAVEPPPSSSPALKRPSAALLVDHLQQPASCLRVTHPPSERATAGLHAKSGVYFSPPAGIDTRVKRNFINSPSATMSSAAASISSTLTNTPRMLATPRQQFSAAVNAISTKASPAFTPFSHAHQQHNGAMTSRPGGLEDRIPAARLTNAADARDFGGSGMNGDAGLKSTRALGASDGDFDGKQRLGGVTEAATVWNLRSRPEIAKMERKLLSILESDCTALRSSDQVQLPTFLRVEKLKLRASCNLQHPFLSRATALGMFGTQSTSSQQAVKSDFFYSPFEKQTKRQTAGQRDGQEDDKDDAPAMYERGFPVYEQIELQLTLSNPTGVAVKLQEVKAWVKFVQDGNEAASGDSSNAVECYPCFFTMAPYEKRKTVALRIQPLRVGSFHLRGCFIRAFNIKTSFELTKPVSIRVVGELPMVSLSLREHGSMALVDGDKGAVATNEPLSGKMRLAMFASETRRCMLRVRSTGNQQITSYRLAVTVQQRRAAKKTCVAFNNLPSVSSSVEIGTGNGTRSSEPASGQIETQTLTLRCGKVVSSPLPLASGDFVSLPFEVSLRESNKQFDDGVQIEWSFVYANETNLSAGKTDTAAVFYRESKLALELVPLPSLMLRSVAFLPCSAAQTPVGVDGSSTTDHLYCVVMVHVVNPTETTFRFRLRRDIDDSGEVTCEAEIGRQCSRRFVVEVPRLQMVATDSSLTEALNDLLEMEWETYYGTRGRLLCEEQHVGPDNEQKQMRLELALPPLSFQIQSSLQDVEAVTTGEEFHNGNGREPKPRRDRSLSLHPLSFFQATHLRVESRTLQAELFQYVPITIAVQRAGSVGSGQQPVSGVEVDVVVTEEGEETNREMSGQVLVVGQVNAQVWWSDPADETPKLHEIQCLFLSEGNFRVTVCGRVLGPEKQRVGGEIWSHQPMHVRVAEKTVNAI